MMECFTVIRCQQLRAKTDLQFAVDMLQVSLDGVDGYVERRRDLRVPASDDELFDDLPLLRSERPGCRDRRRGRPTLTGEDDGDRPVQPSR